MADPLTTLVVLGWRRVGLGVWEDGSRASYFLLVRITSAVIFLG